MGPGSSSNEVAWEKYLDMVDCLKEKPEIVRNRPRLKLEIAGWLEDVGRFQKDVNRVFRSVDWDRAGRLGWNKGDVRAFVYGLFDEKRWPAPPAKFDFYKLYKEFDTGRGLTLDRCNALSFSHALFGVILRAL